MVLIAFVVLLCILLFAAVTYYLWKRYDWDTRSIIGLIHRHRIYTIVSIIFLMAITATTIMYAIRQEMDALPRLVRWLSLCWGLYCISCTDIKERIIPNQCILALLIVRTLILCYEVFSNLEFLRDVLSYPIIGALMSGVVMAIAMFVSRGGIGMGDLKLFLIIGYFVGSRQIFAVMFYTFATSALFGVVLLITRKAKIKDTMPLAPFACVGVVLEYLLLIQGG